MPRSHKPRKRYIPKRVDPDPLALALHQVSTLTLASRLRLTARGRDAIEEFRTGRATGDTWRRIVDSLNIAEVIAERGLFDGDRPDLYAAAQAAMGALLERRERTGSWTMRGAELTALVDAIACHELQLDAISHGELDSALQEVWRRCSQALAGNAGAGVTVHHTEWLTGKVKET